MMVSEQMSVLPAPATNLIGWGRDLLLLTLALSVWFGIFLGSRPLNNPDEGRYTEIPREMMTTNDYVTPRLNGVKYFEKPPLVYWLSAVTFEVTGVNEWSARFWAAAFGVAGGLLTYAAGRELYGRAAGLASALVLATSLLYYGLSHVILLDLVVGVTMAAALFSFLLAVRQPPGVRRRWLFWGFYAAMALAVLTKGLIGFVLPCAVAFIWLAVFNQWKMLRPCHPFSGGALLLALAAPWHLLAARANPDFLYFYFVHEHFLRFTTRIHGRYEPWWFFIPVLLAGLFPWIVFGWQALRSNLTGGWAARKTHLEAWFLLTWTVVIVLFFSKSQSKLVPYIMPVLPAVAVLLGSYLAGVWANQSGRENRGARIGLIVAAALLALLAVAAAVYPLGARQADIGEQILPWRIFLGLVLTAGALTIGICLWRKTQRAAVVALVATCAIFYIAGNPVFALFDTRTTKELALTLKPRLQPDDTVFCVGTYLQDVPVYLDRLVSVVDYQGEMAFGIDAEPALTAGRFIDGPAFAARWKAPGTAYAFVAKTAFNSWFADAALPCNVVAQRGRWMLVSNRPALP